MRYIDGISDNRQGIGKVRMEGTSGDLICYDVRKGFFAEDSEDFIDLKILTWSDGDMHNMMRSMKLPHGELSGLRKKFAAHVRAMTTAEIDLKTNLWTDVIPADLVDEYLTERIKCMKDAYSHIGADELSEYKRFVMPLTRAMRRVENNKIHVDVKKAAAYLKETNPIHIDNFLKLIMNSAKDGFVQTKINPRASRTRRMSVEGGFPCMSIPHGHPRECITSRFDGGKISVLDFNAIDYRCILKYVGDTKLNNFYEGHRDFHMRTASIFSKPPPDIRAITKQITYTHVYGGSLETLQKTTKLPMIVIQQMLYELDELLTPIALARKALADEAKSQGYVIAPGGIKIDTEEGDHDGKIFGLFAQTFSSFVFGKSVIAANDMLQDKGASSRIIFTVHDEMVIDTHPDELELIDEVAKIMESPVYDMIPVVKVKKGSTYGNVA